MKQVTIDNTKTPPEIQGSQCYRRNNDACSESCPFYEHMPSSSLGDILVLTCNTHQAILGVAGYTE